MIKAPAFHESGHVITAYYYCLPINGVNLHETETALGTASIMNKLRLKFLNDNQYIDFIKSIIAGHESELIYAERNCNMTPAFKRKLFNGACGDYIAASDLIRNRFDDNEIDFEILRKEIKEFLVEHWQAVEILAEDLFNKKELTFKQIDGLISGYFQDQFSD